MKKYTYQTLGVMLDMSRNAVMKPEELKKFAATIKKMGYNTLMLYTEDTYEILKKYDIKGVLHCYSGSLEMALEFIKLGYLIGVGGVVTYKNAKKSIEVIKRVPNNNFIIENAKCKRINVY